MQAPPFIIWTCQRTGGTNLANWLSRVSNRKVFHEPFIPNRDFGHVTQRFRSGSSAEAIECELDGLLETGHSIKHCMETSPWDLTLLLAKRALTKPYRHIFLNRNSARDRLLSLFFAYVTGFWGTDEFGKLQQRIPVEIDLNNSGKLLRKISDVEIPTQLLIQREKICVERMKFICRQICNTTSCYYLSYEDLYDYNENQRVASLVLGILNHLDIVLSEDVLLAHATELLLNNGDQKTKQLYQNFKGYRDFSLVCSGIEKFEPCSKPNQGHSSCGC